MAVLTSPLTCACRTAAADDNDNDYFSNYSHAAMVSHLRQPAPSLHVHTNGGFSFFFHPFSSHLDSLQTGGHNITRQLHRHCQQQR
jgi:hypothetical protein